LDTEKFIARYAGNPGSKPVGKRGAAKKAPAKPRARAKA
ncbi:MAG: hypothetical protein QOI98_335, partial [Solirubrobacteraceae bacterium]|nr:hypothetical protein [Solirubrobacteraceae bacterium]